MILSERVFDNCYYENYEEFMWRYRQLIDYGMDIKKELEEYEESIIQILFKSGSSYGQ